MTSACVVFSTCRIQFIPNDRRAERDYSDRSLIELRQYDFANYSLRALDIEHNKEEIFAIPLENEDQYKRGKSSADPDEVRSTAGTYRLWLNANSRIKFLEMLNAAIEETKLIHHDSPQPSDSPPVDTSRSNRRFDQNSSRSTGRDGRDSPPVDTSRSNRRFDDDSSRSTGRDGRDPPPVDIRRSTGRDGRDPPSADISRSNRRFDQDSSRSAGQGDRDPPSADISRSNRRFDQDSSRSTGQGDRDPPSADTSRSNRRFDEDSSLPTGRDVRDPQRPAKQSDQIDFVDDVYQLGQHIKRGRTDDAVNLAKKLSQHNVRLEANVQENLRDESPIQIRVKIDGIDRNVIGQQKEFTMNVYPSTTIAELRAAFQYAKQYQPSNQYFFVNGHMAHEKSTMKELNIDNDVLFVLFLIG